MLHYSKRLVPVPPTYERIGAGLGRPFSDLIFAKWGFNNVDLIGLLFTLIYRATGHRQERAQNADTTGGTTAGKGLRPKDLTLGWELAPTITQPKTCSVIIGSCHIAWTPHARTPLTNAAPTHAARSAPR